VDGNIERTRSVDGREGQGDKDAALLVQAAELKLSAFDCRNKEVL
jgi:hypothetical protein